MICYYRFPLWTQWRAFKGDTKIFFSKRRRKKMDYIRITAARLCMLCTMGAVCKLVIDGVYGNGIAAMDTDAAIGIASILIGHKLFAREPWWS